MISSESVTSIVNHAIDLFFQSSLKELISKFATNTIVSILILYVRARDDE